MYIYHRLAANSGIRSIVVILKYLYSGSNFVIKIMILLFALKY